MRLEQVHDHIPKPIHRCPDHHPLSLGGGLDSVLGLVLALATPPPNSYSPPRSEAEHLFVTKDYPFEGVVFVIVGKLQPVSRVQEGV